MTFHRTCLRCAANRDFTAVQIRYLRKCARWLRTYHDWADAGALPNQRTRGRDPFLREQRQCFLRQVLDAILNAQPLEPTRPSGEKSILALIEALKGDVGLPVLKEGSEKRVWQRDLKDARAALGLPPGRRGRTPEPYRGDSRACCGDIEAADADRHEIGRELLDELAFVRRVALVHRRSAAEDMRRIAIGDYQRRKARLFSHFQDCNLIVANSIQWVEEFCHFSKHAKQMIRLERGAPLSRRVKRNGTYSEFADYIDAETDGGLCAV